MKKKPRLKTRFLTSVKATADGLYAYAREYVFNENGRAVSSKMVRKKVADISECP